MEQANGMQSLMEVFTEANRNAWERWMSASQNFNNTAQMDETYKSNLEAGERLVKDVLRVEGEWLKAWRQLTHSVGELPQPMVDFAERGLDLASEMLDSRAKLWDRWFESARAVDLEQLSSSFKQPGQKSFANTWSDMSKRAVESQAQWLKAWAAQSVSGAEQGAKSGADALNGAATAAQRGAREGAAAARKSA